MSVEDFKKLVTESKNIVFFGGAGVSTESNIPDFRSETGIYSGSGFRFAPEVMLSHEFFYTHPKEFYQFYFEKLVYPDAEPNAAHLALAELERQGILRAVITQNVDGLHQKAGSRIVLELHGSALRNTCTRCGKKVNLDFMLRFRPGVPTCECGGIVRPDIVLYGEGLDADVVDASVRAISLADLLIVGGTSLVVYPAAGLIRYFRGRNLVLINRDRTDYDDSAALVFHDSIGKILSQVVAK
ncbi:MAG TPA: NAD-dependent protein deacylase [Clostridia bacterium]|nr:NAD-dependent protein deacylase [Clostridia bacterium]